MSGWTGRAGLHSIEFQRDAKPPWPYCSFCEKTYDNPGHHLIAGPPPEKPMICRACVELCTEIFAEMDANRQTEGRREDGTER